MNKSRELFLLFPYVGQKVLGYTLIHKHTSLNDEPPYKMCSFFNVSSDYYIQKASEIEADEEWSVEERYSFYLIRNKDVQKFINWMNQTEKDYLDDYYQLQVENGYDDNPKPLSSGEIDEICSSERSMRRPKVKYMSVQPISL